MMKMDLSAGDKAATVAASIAITLSVVFNVVILALWWTQFGNIYADQKAALEALKADKGAIAKPQDL